MRIRILAGQYYDAETGLHYNWNRYYDPELGRYLRPDPIGIEGGINLYSYVLNDPINAVDPHGLGDLLQSMRSIHGIRSYNNPSGFEVRISRINDQHLVENQRRQLVNSGQRANEFSRLMNQEMNRYYNGVCVSDQEGSGGLGGENAAKARKRMVPKDRHGLYK